MGKKKNSHPGRGRGNFSSGGGGGGGAGGLGNRDPENYRGGTGGVGRNSYSASSSKSSSYTPLNSAAAAEERRLGNEIDRAFGFVEVGEMNEQEEGGGASEHVGWLVNMIQTVVRIQTPEGKEDRAGLECFFLKED